jgi:hypothetical protein
MVGIAGTLSKAVHANLAAMHFAECIADVCLELV